MKRAMLIIFVLNCALLATAQQQNCRSVRAHVPFAFQMSGITMPAGDYQFCWKWNRTAVITPLSAEAPVVSSTISSFEKITQEKAMLIFRHLGNEYFLAEIHQPGEAIAVLAISPEEQRYNKIAVKKVPVPADEVGK